MIYRRHRDMYLLYRFAVIAMVAVALSSCNQGAGTSGKAGSGNSEAQGLLVSGKELYTLHLYNEALAKFDQVLASWPDSTEADDAHYYRGKTLYQLGDLAGAMSEFQIVVSDFPASGLVDNAALWIGRIKQAQADFVAARLQYQLVLDSWPTRDAADDAAYELAKSWYDEKNYAEAITRLQAFIDAWPGSIKLDDAAYFLARSYHRAALYDDARLAYEDLVLMYPLSTWVDNARHHIARTWYDQGQYQTAIDQFSGLLSSDPAAGKADASNYYLARSYHARARVNLDVGLTAAADVDFQAALVIYDQVIALYAASIYLDNAAYQKAVVYFDQQQDALALAQLNTVLVQYPADTLSDDAVLLSGVIYRGQGLFAESRACFEVLLADAPTFSGLCNGIDFSGAGFVSSSLRDNARYYLGKTWYDEAISSGIEVYWDTARTELAKVIALYPGSSLVDDAIYYTGRSWQRQLTANLVAAENEFLKLLDPMWVTSPLQDNVNFRLGEIGHATQDCLMEAQYMSALVNGYPDSPYVAEAQLHLDDLALIPPVSHTCV